MNAPAKKRMPAYGKALLERRRAGDHPLTVNVVLGNAWWKVKEPKICVKPEDYAPGVFDWRVVAGVRALVVANDAFRAGGDAAKVGDLLGELADHAAVVDLWCGDGAAVSADVYAWGERKLGKWPEWWNAERDRRMIAGRNAWFGDVARNMHARHGVTLEAIGD